MTPSLIRVELPAHLRLLGKTTHPIDLSVESPITQRTVLDALEVRYPALQGTIRDNTTRLRRPFLRFFACGQDLSHEFPDDPLPEAVAQGREPFLIIGSISGG